MKDGGIGSIMGVDGRDVPHECGKIGKGVGRLIMTKTQLIYR